MLSGLASRPRGQKLIARNWPKEAKAFARCGRKRRAAWGHAQISWS